MLTMGALVYAGEVIFGLPFHVARYFRPTLLATVGMTNTELGALFSCYGVVAMLSYLPGGAIADRCSARVLLTASLVATGLLGLVLATLPGPWTLALVFAGFGMTTILLFWAALIRATREWAGADDQGKAFGLLEAGRGLVSAGLASLALIPFHRALGSLPAVADAARRADAIEAVIYVYTAATLLAALCVFALVPGQAGPRPQVAGPSPLAAVLRRPAVWLHALLTVLAYCAYKGIDDHALYAVQAHGLSEVEGSQVVVAAAWVRPVAAVAAGYLADRTHPTTVTAWAFVGLCVGHLAFVLLPRGALTLLWMSLIATSAMIFAVRGVYFAILEERGVPRHSTGAAVGLVSVVGFLPDVFFAPLAGWLLDRSPGAAGHHHLFLLLAATSAAGLVVTLALRRRRF